MFRVYPLLLETRIFSSEFFESSSTWPCSTRSFFKLRVFPNQVFSSKVSTLVCILCISKTCKLKYYVMPYNYVLIPATSSHPGKSSFSFGGFFCTFWQLLAKKCAHGQSQTKCERSLQ